jgi:hypothetical protein
MAPRDRRRLLASLTAKPCPHGVSRRILAAFGAAHRSKVMNRD